MDKNKQLYIHVGAPRTGTSFLRKNIFSKIPNINFDDKLKNNSDVTKIFSEIAHWGDGDELSNSIPNYIELKDGKTLISEEHFIWSVYHMMGNIGSRALMLKNIAPDAKILITIRRQPEYVNSIFQYFQDLEHWHLISKMNSLKSMLNLSEKIESVELKESYKVPVGIEYKTELEITDVGLNYFRRDQRHFIAADLSWFRLYKIYSMLFGKENVLVIPQEIWKSKPAQGIKLLEGFFNEKIELDQIDFKEKVNTSKIKKRKGYQENENERIKEYILSRTWESNRDLDTALEYLDLECLGYLEVGNTEPKERKYGLNGLNHKKLNAKLINSFLGTLQIIKKIGMYRFFTIYRKPAFSRIYKFFKKNIYLIFSTAIQRVRGLDFDKIESLDELGLNSKNSEQYEATKNIELKKIFACLDLPKKCNAVDFGAGKGKVVWYLSTLKSTDKVVGVEISKKLVEIAKKNLEKLKAVNTEMICCDARDIPRDILDNTQLFYFYNPFPEDVFKEVLELIADSINTSNPRKVVLVYFNPVFDELITNSKLFESRKVFDNLISNAKTIVYFKN